MKKDFNLLSQNLKIYPMKVRRIICFLFLAFSLSLYAQAQDLPGLSTSLQEHVYILASDSMEGRGLGTEGTAKARDYIVSQFSEIGLTPYNETGYIMPFSLQYDVARIPAYNIIGYIRGSDPVLQNEYILMGAHYDHVGYSEEEGKRIIYNGADDNASGVAVMLELAKYFSGLDTAPSRSILFVAFDAEESGLLGSQEFVQQIHPGFSVKDIKVMFSIDMVGMYSSNKGLDMRGMGTLEDGMNLANQLANTHGLQLGKLSADVTQNTDTKPFGDVGIPSIQPFTGYFSPYHQPEDTYEKLDYDGMALITVFLAELISEMALMPTIQPSPFLLKQKKPFAEEKRTICFDAGFKFIAGVSKHHFPDEFYHGKNVLAYGGGLFAQIHFEEFITLQPEVLFYSDGSKTSAGRMRRYSLDVPVDIHFNLINDNRGEARFFLSGGLFRRFNISGENGGIKMDYTTEYTEKEYGYRIGFGWDVSPVQFKILWIRSLTNLIQSNTQDIRPYGWNVSLGIRF
jgi:aminopeptidase YwaD